eukprot:COSAG02_NODE_2425_length_8891_cov_48.519791_1_plen_519_part_00
MAAQVRFTNPVGDGAGTRTFESSGGVSPAPPASPIVVASQPWKVHVPKEKKEPKVKKPKKTKEEKTKEKKKKKKKDSKSSKTDDTVDFDNPLSSTKPSLPKNDWPRKNGRMKLDTKRSGDMVMAIQKLYGYLRTQHELAREAGTRDPFGLWMHLDDSDDEKDGSDDDEPIEGEIHYDDEAQEAQRSARKLKHAIRVGDPMKMPIADVQAQLQKLGQSARGDKKTLRARLQIAYSQQAQVMQGNTRVIQHFHTELTKRNIQILLMKVNKGRTKAVQDKLELSHGEIREMQAEIERQRQMLADLRMQLEAARHQGRVTVVRKVGHGVPRPAITMPVSTKVTGRLLADWNPWTQADIAEEKARSTKCHVLVLDMSGFRWDSKFRKRKTKDGRSVEVHQSAWHLINVAATSHFGGCAIVDQIYMNADGDMEHKRFIPDIVLVRQSCSQLDGEDYTHQLRGFLCSRTPCVNSATALLSCLDRPMVYSELLGIRNKEGKTKSGRFKFPLVEQEYFANGTPPSIR